MKNLLKEKPTDIMDVHSSIISIGAFINHFSNKLFLNKVYNSADYVQSVLGTSKASKGFDQWFVDLENEDQLKLISALSGLPGGDDQISNYRDALVLLILDLINSDTTLHDWVLHYQQFYTGLYYWDLEYLGFIQTVLNSSSEGKDVLLNIKRSNPKQ